MKTLLKFFCIVLGTILTFMGILTSIVSVLGIFGALFTNQVPHTQSVLVTVALGVIYVLIGAMPLIVGLLLLKLANSLSYLSLAIPEQLSVPMWLLLPGAPNSHGMLAFDGAGQDLKFTTDAGQTTLFPFSEIGMIKLPRRSAVNFVEITFAGKTYTFHPYAQATGLEEAKKLVLKSLFFGVLGSATSAKAIAQDANVLVPSDTSTVISRWLKTHHVAAYKQLLGPSEISVLIMLLAFPLSLLLIWLAQSIK
jgi:hypothetical protein